MQRKFFVLPLLAALLLLVAFGTGMRCIAATATHVTDANSFDATANFNLGWGDDCPVTNGDQYHVRLLGIHAPTGNECYAQQATDYVKNLVEGKRVCLVRDIGCHDRSGKLLAYVGVNTDPSRLDCDVFLNADLVRQGYARAVAAPPDTTLQWLLDLLQCQAYSEGRGMWGACPDLPVPPGCRVEPTPPAESTATPAPAESTATPAPAESTATPAPRHNAARFALPVKPAGIVVSLEATPATNRQAAPATVSGLNPALGTCEAQPASSLPLIANQMATHTPSLLS